MKKLISIGASLILAVSLFATGNEGVNPPQNGVITVANSVPNVTNTFAFPFQTTPLLVVYCNAANGSPITNNFVTTTNFAISFPALGTNDAYAWQAFVGGTRMQSGTFSAGAGTNILFNYPYASTPSVVVSGSLLPAATNNMIVVYSASATNFSINTGNTNQTVYWISVGTVYNPSSENVGQNPPVNKVVY